MAIISILSVLIFSMVLCVIEIPKMIKEGLYRELNIFCILLATGTLLGILKSLNVKIPNPSDFIAWVYSPVKGIMESLLK